MAPNRQALGRVESVHVVGGVGEPAFQNGWTSLAGYGPVGFWFDHFTGLVHFQGVTQNSGDPVGSSTVFTLPLGFRPALPRIIQALTLTLASTFLQVNPAGTVVIVSDLAASATVYLDGLYFRL